VRFSEKLLEKSGITVETFDLSEVFGRIARLPDNDPSVTAKLQQIDQYIQTQGHSGGIAAQDGEARRGDRRLDAGDAAARHAPSSAGLRSKSISAWCPAQS
jgi:L-fucose isomerase-like protein